MLHTAFLWVVHATVRVSRGLKLLKHREKFSGVSGSCVDTAASLESRDDTKEEEGVTHDGVATTAATVTFGKAGKIGGGE